MPLLERLLEAARSMGRQGDAIRYLTLLALSCHALGEPSAALAHLDQALTLAESEGYVRLFVDEGEPMAELLQAFSRQPSTVSPAYIEKLLATFGTVAHPLSREAVVDRAKRLSLIDALSDRELEVLRLMATGARYKEIAEQLVISLNTVRHHIRNIYGKLGVHRRRQAIARARELDLL
jgi:LuxR family maltose regulon positive regulatory protein